MIKKPSRYSRRFVLLGRIKISGRAVNALYTTRNLFMDARQTMFDTVRPAAQEHWAQTATVVYVRDGLQVTEYVR